MAFAAEGLAVMGNGRRRVAGGALLKQQLRRLDDGFRVEACPHDPVQHGVGDGHDRHALVVRHEHPHHRHGLPGRNPVGRVVQRLVKAVAALAVHRGDPLEVENRRRGIDHGGQRCRVGGNDQVRVQAALQSQAGDAEVRVLVGVLNVADVVGRFRDAPGHVMLPAEADLASRHQTAGVLEQTAVRRAHDQGRHQVLEHRFLRRDGTPWTTDKDGLIVGLLAAEMTARTGTNPAAAYDRIAHDLGRSWYERTDAPATAAERMQLKAVTPEEIGMASLAGEKVRTTITKAPGNGASIEGVKVVADNGWFAARPSGTEDIFKIYAESFRSQAHLRQIQQDAQEAVARVLGQPVPADAA
jgi:hypothetical protein